MVSVEGTNSSLPCSCFLGWHATLTCKETLEVEEIWKGRKKLAMSSNLGDNIALHLKNELRRKLSQS